MNQQTKIWAVGGGKGGVGKSFLTTNIGVLLAEQGKRVVLIDLDLGGANLHTCLGVTDLDRSVSDFLHRRYETLSEALTSTEVENLYLLSGAQDSLNVANPKYAQKMRLLRELKNLDADYILMDLGAGTSFNTLDFFLAADTQLLVAVPEPTSIENAYRFIKSSFYRLIRMYSPTPKLKAFVEEAMDRNNQYGIRTPRELLVQLRAMGEEVETFANQLVERYKPQLVLNQVRTANDIRVGTAMENACLKYFGIYIEYRGYLHNHDAVRKSVLQRKPLMTQFPEAEIGEDLKRLLENILQQQKVTPS
jgi:flagellar biosynthesis protein FlhG